MGNLGDLNNHLFAQMERLNNVALKGDDLAEEIQRTKAVTMIASQNISAGALALSGQRLIDDRMNDNTKLPKMLEG